MKMVKSLEDLPDELLFYIFSFLHPREFEGLSRRCYYLYKEEEKRKFPSYLSYLLKNSLKVGAIQRRLQEKRRLGEILETIHSLREAPKEVREFLSVHSINLALVITINQKMETEAVFFYRDYERYGIYAICGASTSQRRACRNKVPSIGERCMRHKGKRSLFPLQRPYFHLWREKGYLSFLTFDQKELETCNLCLRIKRVPCQYNGCSNFLCPICHTPSLLGQRCYLH